MKSSRSHLRAFLLGALVCSGGCTSAANHLPRPLSEPLVEPGFAVPIEAEGWWVVRRAETDLDGDGDPEAAVLRAEVEVYRGRPLWEDGHRWNLYVREENGTTTDLYARFVPWGRVEALLVSPGEASGRPAILLTEQTPERIIVYEIHYQGPGRAEAAEILRRPLDPVRGFAEPQHSVQAQKRGPPN